MTREELKVQAAKKEMARIASHATLYKGTIDEIEVYEPDDMIDMFKLGAEWSDEHSNSEDVIDKAHVWLMENYDKYVRVIGGSIYFAYFELGRDFRKAMEG